jgi:hypothetical protein
MLPGAEGRTSVASSPMSQFMKAITPVTVQSGACPSPWHSRPFPRHRGQPLGGHRMFLPAPADGRP